MIAHVAGTLVAKTLDRVEIMTAGGVGYELLVPLSVYETLPRAGEAVRLHTYLVVREDGWQLFGFSSAFERQVFQRVLDAKGVGPALALGMLSTLSAERLVRAIREKDIVTLQSVPRVGRKQAAGNRLESQRLPVGELRCVDWRTTTNLRHSSAPALDDSASALDV